MTQPLSGIRVLDLTRMVAGPWSTQLLGDMGAEVIKIERPGVGDEMRAFAPLLKDKDGVEAISPSHLAVNRNKKSVAIDLSRPEGADLVREMAKVCDIFVENYKVGDLRRYGLDYESIRSINPGIVYCSVTGFGQTGPSAHRPGLDSLFQAESGLMAMTGEPDGEPQKVGVVITDFTAGMYATVGILGALFHRKVNGGAGQHIDVALLDSTIASFTHKGQICLSTGELPERTGTGLPGNPPGGLFPCADGQILLTAGADGQFRNFARVIGHEDWIEDPRFVTRAARVANREAMYDGINAALAKHPRAYWLDLFQQKGVMCAPINTLVEAFEDPHVKHRKVAIEIEHPRVGTIELINNPIRMSETPMPTPTAPPELGEHTERVLADLLGLTQEGVEHLKQKGAI